MRILITGAGGFIGSHMVDRCVRDGHEVIATDKKPYKEWICGEKSPYKSLTDLDIVDVSREWRLRDFDLCYHLAAESRIQPSFSDPIEYIRSNVLGTAAVLNLAKKQNTRVVYAGSSTADGDIHSNVYATSKMQGEELCKTWHQCFGLHCDIARFYNVYGPRQIEDGQYATVIGIFERQCREVYEHIEKNQCCDGLALTVTGNGKQRRDFTHVDDIVDGLVAIAEKGKGKVGIYNLGTGKNHSILEVAKLFMERGGPEISIKFIPRPPGESEETCALDGISEDRIGWEPEKRLEDYVTSLSF